MTSVRALGKGGVSGKGREKKLKEREQSVRFKDELRPCAPGTQDQSRRLTIFSCRGWQLSGSPASGSTTFPPVDLKYFSLMMILKIRGYSYRISKSLTGMGVSQAKGPEFLVLSMQRLQAFL